MVIERPLVGQCLGTSTHGGCKTSTSRAISYVARAPPNRWAYSITHIENAVRVVLYDEAEPSERRLLLVQVSHHPETVAPFAAEPTRCAGSGLELALEFGIGFGIGPHLDFF